MQLSICKIYYYRMSFEESPKGSSNGSAGSFTKNVQKLIDSDEDDQIVNRMVELQKTFPILSKMNLSMTNIQKVSLFLRDHNFRNKLNDKLKQKAILNIHPIVKLQLYSIRYRSIIDDQFHKPDIFQAVAKFGKIVNFYCHEQYAYVEYSDHPSAYVAIKILNDFPINQNSLRMSVKWCEGPQQALIAQNLFMAVKSPETIYEQTNKPAKYMCKYTIHIDGCPSFKTAQKIIGPQGSYMKRIIDRVSHHGADTSSKENTVKLRLRGRGSGYKQFDGLESEERMHLCVSAKSEEIYRAACCEVQELLLKVIQDYKLEHQKQHNKMPKGVGYRRIQGQQDRQIQTKVVTLEEVDNAFDLGVLASGNKIKQSEIKQIIGLRQKARKLGQFKEADEMRDKLKKMGVCLIDQKNNKGKNKKTCWKYADQ